MNKSQIIESISSRISFLDNLISRNNSLSANKSKSHLIVSTTRKVARYYQITGKGKSTTRTYVSDTNELKALAENTYQEKLIKAAVKEKAKLERCIRALTIRSENSDIEEVFDSLQEPIKALVKPYEETDEGYARKWQAKRKRAIRIDSSHQYKTDRGEYVRSKSEALIANRLLAKGIPYAYEYDCFFDESTGFSLHPDFTVLNKRTRKEFIWEHCGRMDDDQYCNMTLHRILVFAGCGYIQGKNLLFSYETNASPINMDYIDILINEFLL